MSHKQCYIFHVHALLLFEAAGICLNYTQKGISWGFANTLQNVFGFHNNV